MLINQSIEHQQRQTNLNQASAPYCSTVLRIMSTSYNIVTPITKRALLSECPQAPNAERQVFSQAKHSFPALPFPTVQTKMPTQSFKVSGSLIRSHELRGSFRKLSQTDSDSTTSMEEEDLFKGCRLPFSKAA